MTGDGDTPPAAGAARESLTDRGLKQRPSDPDTSADKETSFVAEAPTIPAGLGGAQGEKHTHVCAAFILLRDTPDFKERSFEKQTMLQRRTCRPCLKQLLHASRTFPLIFS